MSQIEIKDAAQLKLMRRAGLVVSDGLAAMCGAAAIGVTTRELDSIGREVLARNGALSSFLGYGAEYGFGTPEFLALLDSLGAEGLMIANFGTGTPELMA